MRKYYFIISFVFTLWSVCQVQADLIDFEGTGLSEGASLTTQIPGLTFVNTIIAEEGSPTFAFSTDDTIVGGAPFDGFFITDSPVGGDVGVSQTIAISFDVPVFDVSCSIADLDVWVGDLSEVLTAKAYDSDNTLLQSITITAGDPGTGDEIATLVEFSIGNVSRLTLNVDNSVGRAGWGVDNLSFTPVPVPSAVFLGILGLSAVGVKLRKFA
jgi:hypothetical protein